MRAAPCWGVLVLAAPCLWGVWGAPVRATPCWGVLVRAAPCRGVWGVLVLAAPCWGVRGEQKNFIRLNRSVFGEIFVEVVCG